MIIGVLRVDICLVAATGSISMSMMYLALQTMRYVGELLGKGTLPEAHV